MRCRYAHRPPRVHHFRDRPLKGFGFSVSFLGFARHRSGRPLPWTRSDHTQIVFFEDGDGLFERDGYPDREIAPGCVVVQCPLYRSRRNPAVDGFWDHYWVTVQGSAIDTWMRHQETTGEFGGWYCPGEPMEIREWFEATLQQATGTTPERICSRLPELLFLITRSHTTDPHARVVEGIAARFRRNPERTWQYEALAREHGISYPTLRRIFRQGTGMSLHQFVLLQRIRRATALLYGGHRVGDAAYASGFTDLAHFSRTFRRHHGRSPRDLLKESRGW